MLIDHRRYVFFILMLLPSLCIGKNTLILSTGTETGSYYPTGLAISQIVERSGEHKIDVIDSSGSDENLRELIDGNVNLAIVQADILHKFRFSQEGEEYYKYKDRSQNIKTIVALFPEYIQILVRADDDIINIFKLDGEDVYIGKEKSGTRLNAIDILSFFGIKYTQKIGGEITKFSEAVSALKNNKIRAIFDTSGVFNKDPEMRILPIDRDLARQFIKEYPYYVHKNIETKINGNVDLFVTRAILVARENSLSEYDANYIAREIFENQYDLEKNVDKNVQFFYGDSMVRKISQNLHLGAKNYFLSKDIIANTGGAFYSVIAFSVIVVVIAISQWGKSLKLSTKIFIRRLMLFRFKNITPKNIWIGFLNFITNSVWRIAVAFFFLALSIGISIILYYETAYSNLHDVENPFSGKGLWDVLYWVTTFGITGFNQDIYPNSLQAKISAIAIPIVAVFGAIFTMMFGFFQKSHRADKEQRGLDLPELGGHVIICGWNDRVPKLIREITSDFSPKKHIQVVVIAEMDEEKPLEKYNFQRRRVYYLRGISSNYKILEKASLLNSSAAIIVADKNKVSRRNLRGIYTNVAIRSLVDKSIEEYKIISELYYPENKTYFVESGVTKMVCLEQTPIRFISHACVNPGISNIIIDLLSFGPPYQAKVVGLSDQLLKKVSSKLIGRTLSETIMILRNSGLLLLSLYRKHGESEHSALELNFKETNSPYIINHENSDSIRISKNDKFLIVNPVTEKRKEHSHSKFFKNGCTAQTYGDNEYLMIIGDGDACLPLISILQGTCQNILYILVDGHSKDSLNVQSYGNVKVIYTKMIDSNFAILNQSDLNLVTRVIIPSSKSEKNTNDLGIYQDDYTMMLSKSVLNIYKKCECICKDNIHILAEIKDHNNMSLFHDIGITQPVPTNIFIDNMLSQMVFHGGMVSEFFLKTMDLSSNNTKARLVKLSVVQLERIVEVDVKSKVYDEILELGLTSRIQLLAIEKASCGDIILNPPINSENSKYPILEHDYLYVFLSGKVSLH